MGLDLLFVSVLFLAALAIFGLIAGISNDAVNFLNSSIGSRAAPRAVIFSVAVAGILVGVGFSSGMMEVARKGIFNPELFTMPQLITLFLAVMIANGLLLDMFNTHGLPTSTTVSIVFSLLGSAVAVSSLKIIEASGNLASLADYINTASALKIIGGILLSVVVAFALGTIIQFGVRTVFTFDYLPRLKRYGAIFGGLAFTSIAYFIVIKGTKGTTFIPDLYKAWITDHTLIVLAIIFVTSSIALQIYALFGWNILKPIVLLGTFSLSMAFAANDLVNFIGVPMAGYQAYNAAHVSGDLNTSMESLREPVSTETGFLLFAGLIMATTLCLSKKARTVSETEIQLGQQEEGSERFGSTRLSRNTVGAAIQVFDFFKGIIPITIQRVVSKRFDHQGYDPAVDEEQRPAFDMLRATVNLMVASAIISYATSYKLPLSTTYVTFMVAMGASFADRAWGRESAVYRITGVLTVIGGWFFTALCAFILAGLLATLIYYTQFYGVVALAVGGLMLIWKNHHTHQKRVRSKARDQVFNIAKVNDINESLDISFEHTSILLGEIRESLDRALEALFHQNNYVLALERDRSAEIERWANIVTANVFKTMRLLQQEEVDLSYKYGRTGRRLQKLAEGHRDIVYRACDHVGNYHKGLLEEQVEELREVKARTLSIIADVEATFRKEQGPPLEQIVERQKSLAQFVNDLEVKQTERIKDDSSKTRLSILYYAVLGNVAMLARQNRRLMQIYAETFGHVEGTDFDFEYD